MKIDQFDSMETAEHFLKTKYKKEDNARILSKEETVQEMGRILKAKGLSHLLEDEVKKTKVAIGYGAEQIKKAEAAKKEDLPKNAFEKKYPRAADIMGVTEEKRKRLREQTRGQAIPYVF